MKFLVESERRVPTDVEDKRIKDIIYWCADQYNSLFNDIDLSGLIFRESYAEKPCGYQLPRREGSVGQILVDESKCLKLSDDDLKSWILHAIGHYVDIMNKIKNGELWIQGGQVVSGVEFNPHSQSWKHIVDQVEGKTGIRITATHNVKIDDAAARSINLKKREKSKYVIVCDKCGYEWYYPFKTQVVKYPQDFKHHECGGRLKRVK